MILIFGQKVRDSPGYARREGEWDGETRIGEGRKCESPVKLVGPWERPGESQKCQ